MSINPLIEMSGWNSQMFCCMFTMTGGVFHNSSLHLYKRNRSSMSMRVFFIIIISLFIESMDFVLKETVA